MSWWDRIFRRGPRLTGYPTSSNRASSMHLLWAFAGDEPLVEVSTVLEIVSPPAVGQLYFWALQASFGGGGAGHLGLQWGADPRRPGPFHANWGGYSGDGRELTGSGSALPSSTNNPNTRNYEWAPGRPYRLRIARGTHGWRGEVTDLVGGGVIVIRELDGPGDTLASPVVWSEVFARCDDPPVTARWSDLAAVTAGGAAVRPAHVRTNYQSSRDGGCDNGTIAPDGNGFLQQTSVARTTPGGIDLPVT